MASRVKKNPKSSAPPPPAPMDDMLFGPRYKIIKKELRWQVIHEDEEHLRITERQAQACADLLNQMARFPEAREITVHVRR